MTRSIGSFAAQLKFLFDQHASGPALRQLQAKGVDVIHVSEVHLSEADDPEIFAWARREERIIVTRNYRDFAPLVDRAASDGLDFPGVLFFSNSIRQNDVGHHVRSLLGWIERAETAGRNVVRRTYEWLN